MDEKQADIIRYIRTLTESHKREIFSHFAELKLKLPTYMKTLTINQLREAGAIVNPDINLPKDAEDCLRNHADSSRRRNNILEKIKEVRDQFRNQVVAYYKNIKQKLPQELLEKKINELSEGELDYMGLDIKKFKHKNGTVD